MSDLDPRELRSAFGRFMTGVTVVTACDAEGTPVGFTANSFSSVSLDPPLLLVCPARALSSFPVFASCERFAVSVLAEGQEEVSNIFAAHTGDRFAKIAWRPNLCGVPLIEGACAHFSCRSERVIPAGDHAILLGAVETFEQSGARGLGYAAGGYFSLGLEREAAAAPRPGIKAVAGALVIHGDRILLEETPEGLRPPQISLAGRERVRAVLDGWFEERGLEVTLGKAYSIFEDRDEGLHYSYFQAWAGSEATGGLGRFIPIHGLAERKMVTEAHAAMLRRFALEFETQSFGLYVGDETAGDVHAI